jgi:hypothetical protein
MALPHSYPWRWDESSSWFRLEAFSMCAAGHPCPAVACMASTRGLRSRSAGHAKRRSVVSGMRSRETRGGLRWQRWVAKERELTRSHCNVDPSVSNDPDKE